VIEPEHKMAEQSFETKPEPLPSQHEPAQEAH